MITLHRHEISADITDRYAVIQYLFDFENNSDQKNQSDELSFEITIDPNAFISKFEANVDGELFIGQTKEKETASKEYKQAKEKKENAILIYNVDKNIPNVFGIKTNIDAQSKILLTIQIEQYIQKLCEFNEMNIQILRNFVQYNITEKFEYIPLKLNIFDQSGIYNIDIPNTKKNIIINEQIMDKNKQKCAINGKIMKQSAINEVTLTYKTKGQQNDSHILFDANSNTFCHIISDILTDATIIDEKEEGIINNIKNDIWIPRRVIFVIDKSGSMKGSKWNKTISSTIIALQQLRKEYDRFCIILFNEKNQLLPYNLLLANNKTIHNSVKVLKQVKPEGGTNINDALLKAIQLIKHDISMTKKDKNDNFFMNQIIVITDGKPSNGERDTKQILDNVKKANNLSTKVSIFAFGVGNSANDAQWIRDLNHSFLRILSVNNNGFYQRIKDRSADTALNQCFSILSQPIVSNIKLKYENTNIRDVTQTQFHTFYAGNDLIVCGKMDNPQNCIDDGITLSISAITGKEMKQNDTLIRKSVHISKHIKVDIDANSNADNVERIWAYLKLQQLATKQLIYNDMIDMDEEEKKENDCMPLKLAMEYKFVTPWTSMVVVKEKNKHKQATQTQIISAATRKPIQVTKAYNNNNNNNNNTGDGGGGGAMSDDIAHLAMDQQLLSRNVDFNYKTLPLWKTLHSDESTQEMEQKLANEGQLKFDVIFNDPIGYHLMKLFLDTEYSVDKAIFVDDVKTYQKLQNSKARATAAQKIYQSFCAEANHKQTHQKRTYTLTTATDNDANEETKQLSTDNATYAYAYNLSLFTENTNSIGVYGVPIKRLQQKLKNEQYNNTIFDEITKEVYNDLRLDVFPRFCRSHLYQIYLRCKVIEQAPIDVRDFYQMRMLGRGAFGCVNACQKIDTGKLYAMKQLNMKRVEATKSKNSVLSEKNILMVLDSRFVTSLKYSFRDDEILYFVMDLSMGGDLKYHLNRDRTFTVERTRFYAAQILLGLYHIHSNGIVYRDLKLENILVDERGHCKISDFGLAVKMDKNNKYNGLVRGYAGTPGYTAPEVVLSHYYDHVVDFFSLGILIYRCICGKKPFQAKKRRRKPRGQTEENRRKKRTTELDRNVVEMTVEYPAQYFEANVKSLLKGLICKNPTHRLGGEGIDEIINHPWFDLIDFGLLEIGHLKAPFIPSLDEVHANSDSIGRPKKDELYEKHVLSPDFYEQLKEFRYTSKKAIQQEIVEVLEQVKDETNAINEIFVVDDKSNVNGGDERSRVYCCIIS